PDKLTAYRLTPGEVIAAVRAQNVLLAVGEINQAPAPKGVEYAATVITRGRLTTTEEFGNVVVRAQPD
ncbi:efflux RND transporter permease subunit, partial [Acinetobacter baumannii]|uniref:efflux RND transporter permease subunit n=1 Tax=Acinetobacter baumannii TaxID=470 RepID=UPI00114733F5